MPWHVGCGLTIHRAWVINPEDLVLQKALSGGTFGEVWQGSWQGIDVAVKRLRQSLLEMDSFVRSQHIGLVK